MKFLIGLLTLVVVIVGVFVFLSLPWQALPVLLRPARACG